jgi:hypothetical protein
VAVVVFDHAGAQGLVGRLLVLAPDRGVHAQPAYVCGVAVLLEDRGARHLGDVVRLEGERLPLVRVEPQRLGHRLLVLVIGEPAHVAHATQHVLLALLGPLRVHEGVLARRRLRQPGEQGCFGGRELRKVLPEIDVGGRPEAVGALPQEYLVDVELENLVLGEVRLDLECEQHLRQLACEGLFPGQEEGAGHLHRDGAGTLAPALEVGRGGAHHPHVVDAAMLVEPIVLGGEDRGLHDLRHVLDLDYGALLLAELADQLALRAVDPHRDLGAIVGQDLEAGKVGPEQDDRQRAHAHGDQDEGHGDQGGVEPPTGGHRSCGCRHGIAVAAFVAPGFSFRVHYSRCSYANTLLQNALHT